MQTGPCPQAQAMPLRLCLEIFGEGGLASVINQVCCWNFFCTTLWSCIYSSSSSLWWLVLFLHGIHWAGINWKKDIQKESWPHPGEKKNTHTKNKENRTGFVAAPSGLLAFYMSCESRHNPSWLTLHHYVLVESDARSHSYDRGPDFRVKEPFLRQSPLCKRR